MLEAENKGAKMAESKKNTTPAVDEGEEYTPETVTVTVKLRGRDETFEMFADPMDAEADVMVAAEQGNFMTFVRGLMTDADSRKAKMMKLTSRELIEIIMPAYNEATEQGED